MYVELMTPVSLKNPISLLAWRFKPGGGQTGGET